MPRATRSPVSVWVASAMRSDRRRVSATSWVPPPTPRSCTVWVPAEGAAAKRVERGARRVAARGGGQHAAHRQPRGPEADGAAAADDRAERAQAELADAGRGRAGERAANHRRRGPQRAGGAHHAIGHAARRIGRGRESTQGSHSLHHGCVAHGHSPSAGPVREHVGRGGGRRDREGRDRCDEVVERGADGGPAPPRCGSRARPRTRSGHR